MWQVAMFVVAAVGAFLSMKNASYVPRPWYHFVGEVLLSIVGIPGVVALVLNGMWASALVLAIFPALLILEAAKGLWDILRDVWRKRRIYQS